MKKKINWADIAVSVAMYAISIFVFIYSAGFKKTMDESLNPDVWPRIICVLLCIAGTIQIVNAVRGTLTIEATFRNMKEVVAAMVAIILYAFLLKKVGFIICSFVLMEVLLVLFHTKSKLAYILLPAITTAAVYCLFKMVLKVPLPLGWLKGIL